MQNRRKFIQNFIQSGAVIGTAAQIGAVSATGLLTSCQTIDETLITDPPELPDQVCVVGGGISGLFSAYELKKRKIPFRLFEASRRLGGQILSSGSNEYGASVFSKNSTTLFNLCKELGVATVPVDAQSWTFKLGSQEFLNRLVEVVSGLVPERQIRLNHKLIKYKEEGRLKELTFSNPKNDKVYKTGKIIFAMPVIEWSKVDGMTSMWVKPEQVEALRVVQVIINSPQWTTVFKKSVSQLKIDDVSVEIKKMKNQILMSIRAPLIKSSLPLEIENIEKWIAQKVLGDARVRLNLNENDIYDWSNHPTLQISRIGDNVGEVKPVPTSRQLLVVNEALFKDSHSTDRVENLLRLVQSQIDRLV